MRILLIDDDPFARQLLTRQLAQLGNDDVHYAADAASALALLDEPAGFDVLLLDLNMPGMDGVEFLRHLARRRFRGSLVIVSGESERIVASVARLARAHRLRLAGTLRKPIALAALRALLEALPQRQPPTTVLDAVRKTYHSAQIAQAIFDGQLVNHYQPQVRLADGEVVGVEALVRWQHPDDGLVLPDQFVAQAEASGLIDGLAQAVLACALADARRWRDEGLNLRLAINVSAINVSIENLKALDFPDRVESAARNAGVDPEAIVLEVTESQAMRDPLVLLDIAARLRIKRIGLAIDDFGTGYSSLANLRDVPFDEMKLDRGFVCGVARDTSQRAILDANLALARRLGLRTVAEGVEDSDDWDSLRAAGCDCAQGWYIARPLPAHELVRWVHSWRPRQTQLSKSAP